MKRGLVSVSLRAPRPTATYFLETRNLQNYNRRHIASMPRARRQASHCILQRESGSNSMLALRRWTQNAQCSKLHSVEVSMVLLK